MAISPQLFDVYRAVPQVEPSLLACDFGHLEREIRRLEEAGARILHLDVMDGHFVPNLSIGIPIVEAVRRSTQLPLDVHLMISQPDRYLEAFRKAGADALSVHIEVAADPTPLLRQIHDLGAAAGIALNPPTPVSAVEPYLDLCESVLVMSVMPGFGGQAFEPATLEKLRRLRAAGGDVVRLAVDGGVNTETIRLCAQAGADLFVIGTALLGQANYTERLAELTGLATLPKDLQA